MPAVKLFSAVNGLATKGFSSPTVRVAPAASAMIERIFAISILRCLPFRDFVPPRVRGLSPRPGYAPRSDNICLAGRVEKRLPVGQRGDQCPAECVAGPARIDGRQGDAR